MELVNYVTVLGKMYRKIIKIFSPAESGISRERSKMQAALGYTYHFK